MEEDGQEGVADEVAGEEGAVGGGVALGEALGALAPVVEVSACWGPAVTPLRTKETGSTRVRRASRKFLLRLERDGMGDVADVEVGDDAKDALLFFEVDLGFGDLLCVRR